MANKLCLNVMLKTEKKPKKILGKFSDSLQNPANDYLCYNYLIPNTL